MQCLEDDDKLLKTMMNDYWNQDKQYQADTFWKNYENWNLQVLYDYGLSNFLARPNSFGNAITSKFILPKRITLRLNKVLRRIANFCRKVNVRTHPFNVYDWVKDNPARIRQMYGGLMCEALFSLPNGNRLIELHDELIGTPREVFEVGGKRFSLSFMRYFYKALMMEKYLKISSSTFFFEIGAGYGGQAQVLLKMFPHLRICLTDLPPQLYVIEQYLKAVFPGEVLGYTETRSMQTIDRNILGENRIVIVAPWELNKIDDDAFENFTNQASFQEMSHGTVKRYCDELHRLITNGIFLYQQREGCGGVENPVTRDDYVDYLSEFKLAHEMTTLLAAHPNGHPNKLLNHNDIYVFKRETGSFA